MRLSEAIRLGAMVSRQAFQQLMSYDGGTCALGAAAEAMGVHPLIHEDMRISVLRARYPTLNDKATCPACSPLMRALRRIRRHEIDVEDVVIHLNDDHRWPREHVAAWVETVEPVSMDGFDYPNGGSIREVRRITAELRCGTTSSAN